MPDGLILGSLGSGWDLVWLTGAILAAGLVRGFAGFGSAMIIMPAAASVLSPFAALTFLVVVEIVGPLPNLRNALRTGALRDAGRLIGGAALALPLGLLALSAMAPEVFGWLVSLTVLALLVLLMIGWRYPGEMTPPLVLGAGGLGGFLAGVSGMPGPPVIMLYMASRQAISVIRANFLLYLLSVDLMMIGWFWLMGELRWGPVVLGLVLMLPYMAANMAGARLFDPANERKFRAVAYVVIACSAILGLPVWKG